MTIEGGIANYIFEMQKLPSQIWDLESQVLFSQHLLLPDYRSGHSLSLKSWPRIDEVERLANLYLSSVLIVNHIFFTPCQGFVSYTLDLFRIEYRFLYDTQIPYVCLSKFCRILHGLWQGCSIRLRIGGIAMTRCSSFRGIYEWKQVPMGLFPSELYPKIHERPHPQPATIPDTRGIHRRLTFPWARRRGLLVERSRHFSNLQREGRDTKRGKLVIDMEKVTFVGHEVDSYGLNMTDCPS